MRYGFLGVIALGAAAALGAASGAGCSAETRDFEGSGGTGATAGAGGEGGGTTTTTTTTTGGGGEGGAPPEVCDPSLPPYDGPLCGPAGAPCSVLADEVLPSPPSFRNDAPAIAVDGSCVPHAAYSVAEGGFHGFYARREAPGTWSQEETPFPIATVSMTAAPDGTPFLLAYDGNGSTALWNRTSGQWVGGTAIPGQAFVNAGAMERDAGGVFIAAVRAGDAVQIARYDSGWSVSPANATAPVRVPMALSPDGTPHIPYWDSGSGTWMLRWVAPPGASEIAAPLGSNSLGMEAQQQAIAVTPPDGQNPTGRPHLLFVRPQAGNPSRQELVYATRQGAGAWNVFVVDQESSQGSFCHAQPQVAGETCDFDFDGIAPLGLVASRGGDVRLLFERFHYMGTYVSECFEPQFCFWQTQTDLSTGQIVVGWMGGNQQAEKVPVVNDIMARSATVRLDALGRMHIAAYDTYPPTQGGTTVRYVQIGH